MTSPPPLPLANPDEQDVSREVVRVFLQTYGRGVAWSGFSRFLVTVLSAVGLGHQHAWSGSSGSLVWVISKGGLGHHFDCAATARNTLTYFDSGTASRGEWYCHLMQVLLRDERDA